MRNFCSRGLRLRSLGPALLIFGATTAWAADGPAIVTIERGGVVEQLDLTKEALEERERRDPQLGETRSYRGVPLLRLLKTRPAPAGTDTLLLIFDNGMQVPVGLSGGALEALDAWVVIASRKGKEPFTGAFPEVVKKKTATPDPRPLRFGNNKLVVARTTNPHSQKDGDFSPWLFVGTLTTLRWINGASYQAAFGGVGVPELARGREVFLSRCQWCHGVRGHGSRQGWDFVQPVPLHSWRSTSSLLAHVRYRNSSAVEGGFMMPQQADVTEEEIVELRKWMAAIATPVEQ